jgi:hypothetical protein
MNQNALKTHAKKLRVKGLVSPGDPRDLDVNIPVLILDIKKLRGSITSFSSAFTPVPETKPPAPVQEAHISVKKGRLPALSTTFEKMEGILFKVLADTKKIVGNLSDLKRKDLKDLLEALVETVAVFTDVFVEKVSAPDGVVLPILTDLPDQASSDEANKILVEMALKINTGISDLMDVIETLKNRQTVIGSGVQGGFAVPGFDNSLKGDMPRKFL